MRGMDDKTFNFFFFLKSYLPLTHDHLCATLFVSMVNSRLILRNVFELYAETHKFPWKLNDINLFLAKHAIRTGQWYSPAASQIVKAKDLKVKKSSSKKET